MTIRVNTIAEKHNQIFSGQEVAHKSHGTHREADAECLYQDALRVQDREARIELLQQCLTINPFHRQANALWESLMAETATQKNIKFHTRSAILAGAVKVFTDRGWQLELEMNNIAQLQKRTSLPTKQAVLLPALLGFIGMMIVILRHLIKTYDHVHLQLTSGSKLTVLHQRESREIDTIDELCEIVNSVPQRLPLIFTLLIGVLSTLVWMAVLM